MTMQLRNLKSGIAKGGKKEWQLISLKDLICMEQDAESPQLLVYTSSRAALAKS